MNKKLVLGITGGSGSGKSQVCSLFQNMGAEVLDADEIGHEILSEEDVLREITVEFGKEILDSEGRVNRKALAGIVFENKNALEALNVITHKRIFDETKKRLSESRAEVVAIDAALIKETRLRELCTFLIAVVAPMPMRVERIMQRDNLTEAQAKARIASQPSDAAYANGVDFVILNNGNLENLNRRTLEIFETIRE